MSRLTLIAVIVLSATVSVTVDARASWNRSSWYNSPSLPKCREEPVKLYGGSKYLSRYGFCSAHVDRCSKGYECCEASSRGRYGPSTFNCQQCEPIDYCLDKKECPRGSTKIDRCDYCKLWGIVCKAECVVEKADIGFILDGSGSVSNDDFLKSLQFVDEIVKGFTIGPNDVQVALQQFSSSVLVDFYLNTFTSDSGLSDEILNTVTDKLNGGTSTAAALDFARTDLFSAAKGRRDNVPQIAFFITDGQSNGGGNVPDSAKALRDSGVFIAAVGIGAALQSELEDIATGSGDENVFMIDDFDDLPKIQTALIRTICNLQDEIDGETSVPDCNLDCPEDEECLVKRDHTTECIKRAPKVPPTTTPKW